MSFIILHLSFYPLFKLGTFDERAKYSLKFEIITEMLIHANVHPKICRHWDFQKTFFPHEILNKSASSRSLFLLHLAISYKVNWFVQFFFLDSRCRHKKYTEVFCLTFFSHEARIIGFSLVNLPQRVIEAM